MKLLYDNIIAWYKPSFIDFPRTVSTVLFFSGCNLRCPYCHNSDIVYNKYPTIGADIIESYLKSKRNMIDGIVITGGEPTLHSNLKDLILHFKSMGFKVKLDTNGLLPNVISSVIHDLDYLAIDVKTSPNSYKNKLGSVYDDCDERLGQSINLIDMSKISYEVRITVAQSIITFDDIKSIGKLIRHITGNVYLQKINKNSKTLDESFSDNTDNKTIELYKNELLKYVSHCEIR